MFIYLLHFSRTPGSHNRRSPFSLLEDLKTLARSYGFLRLKMFFFSRFRMTQIWMSDLKLPNIWETVLSKHGALEVLLYYFLGFG